MTEERGTSVGGGGTCVESVERVDRGGRGEYGEGVGDGERMWGTRRVWIEREE